MSNFPTKQSLPIFSANYFKMVIILNKNLSLIQYLIDLVYQYSTSYSRTTQCIQMYLYDEYNNLQLK